MTTLTPVAATSSFIFLPLTQALVDAHGWRDALVVLAVVLAVVTIPLYAAVLRPAPAAAARAAAQQRDVAAAAALHTLRAPGASTLPRTAG